MPLAWGLLVRGASCRRGIPHPCGGEPRLLRALVVAHNNYVVGEVAQTCGRQPHRDMAASECMGEDTGYHWVSRHFAGGSFSLDLPSSSACISQYPEGRPLPCIALQMSNVQRAEKEQVENPFWLEETVYLK